MPAVAQLVFYLLKIHMRVEVPGVEITPSTKSAMVGHLKNPESSRSASGIEHPALPQDQYKEVLQKVVRFRCVSQNSVRHPTNNRCVATKQRCKSIVVPLGDKSD